MPTKQKLELTWVGKEERPKLEPRILVEDPDKSYGDKNSENMLIHGDNLLALKALDQDFAGKIKCIFIDPPYNTGSAFEHYDDGVEHSIWLSLMRGRLEILNRLLSDEGSLWITIDDNEAHYLKVLCDEVIGRRQFVANIVWQKRTSRENRAAIGSAHDHVLLYAKRGAVAWKNSRNLLPANDSGYSNPDNDPRGPWRSIPFSAQGFRKNQMYKIKTPSGGEVEPPKGRCWAATEPEYMKLAAEKRVYFPNDGVGKPRIKQFKGEEKGLVPMTWWDAELAGDNEAAKKEILNLFPDDEPFGTPKPERLLQQIVQIATNHGDLILDSFAGSGTTGAVAHKMGRRWIMVELGEHANTHCLPRLKKVVDGNDGLPLSEKLDWKGGGGFRYYYLAPSLLKKDKYDNWVIDERYNPNMLAAAMAKHEGFRYSPDETLYWKQGQSTEKDFIFTTTNFITVEHLNKIKDEMKPGESLLICCKSFQEACANRYPSITVKKIPNMLLGRCEFGKEDYSLNIVNMPVEDDAIEPEPDGKELAVKESKKEAKGKKGTVKNQSDLFAHPGS